jgi:two-component system, OmpR family, phosphate regulon response regulator PhoB
VRVLLVEPDPELSARIVAAFGREGIGVAAVRTAAEARTFAPVADLVVTEIALPDGSGCALCSEWREAGIELRRIVLAATPAERVAAFEAGADDVVSKDHLSLRELTLRVRAVARRPVALVPPAVNAVGPVVLDAEHVLIDGQPVHLTSTERALLAALMRRPGRVLDREALAQQVWKGAEIEARTVDSAVKRLRARLGPAGERIETVRGVGYRMRDG